MGHAWQKNLAKPGWAGRKVDFPYDAGCRGQERPTPREERFVAQLDARGILQEHGQEPQVAIIMGSKSDWPTLQHAADMLIRFDVPFQARVVSAHFKLIPFPRPNLR